MSVEWSLRVFGQASYVCGPGGAGLRVGALGVDVGNEVLARASEHGRPSKRPGASHPQSLYWSIRVSRQHVGVKMNRTNSFRPFFLFVHLQYMGKCFQSRRFCSLYFNISFPIIFFSFVCDRVVVLSLDSMKPQFHDYRL